MYASRVSALCLALMLVVVPGFFMHSEASDDQVPPVVAQAPSAEELASDGYLRVAMQDDMKTTNAVIAQDMWDWKVLDWLMNSPVNYEKTSWERVPWMAENWTYDPADPLVASMTLKQGIFWTDHDFDTYGETPYAGLTRTTNPSSDPSGYREVTAYDLVFTIDLLKDAPRYQNRLDALRIDTWGNLDPSDDLMGVTVVDRYTVSYQLSTPVSDMVGEIMALSIFPEHIWSAHLVDKLTWQPEIDEVIFCGMFILDTWVKGSYVRLVTNTHFFNKTAMPNIEGILFRIYGNTDAAVLALESDEVDYIAWAITPGYIPQIEANPELAIASTTDYGFYYMSYNFRNPALGYDDFNSDTRVDVGRPLRIAIGHCVNKSYIVENLLQGRGEVGDSPVSSANAVYYNSSVDRFAFNPAMATNILDNNGYYKVGDWYVSPEGVPIDGPGGNGEIEIIHPTADYDPTRAEAGRMLADQLNAIGIKAKSTPLDFATLIQRTNNHDFEAYILGWSLSGDVGYLSDFFRTDPLDTIGGYNAQGYRNASFDAVVDAMTTTLDLDERISLAKRAQGILSKNLVYDVLYHKDNVEAYRTSNFVSGWWEQSGGIFNQWTIMELVQDHTIPMSVSIAGPTRINSPQTYTVTVTNELTDDAIVGANVEVNTTYGRGTVIGQYSSTGDDGKTNFTYSPITVALDTPETLVARVVYETNEEISSFSLIIEPPVLFWLDVLSETMIPTPIILSEALADGIPFEAYVEDGYSGNPICEAFVNVSNSEGIFDLYSKNTDVDGVAEFLFYPSIGQTSNQTYNITIDVCFFNPLDGCYYIETATHFIAVVVFDNQMNIYIQFSNPAPDLNEETTVTVAVETGNGTGLNGAEVTLASDRNSTIAQSTMIADAQGIAVFTVSFHELGECNLTVTASKDTYENKTAIITLDVQPADALCITVATDNAAPAVNETFVMTVVATDDEGNPLPGINVSLAANLPADISPATALTDAQGIAEFSVTCTQPGTCTFTVSADGAGYTATTNSTAVSIAPANDADDEEDAGKSWWLWAIIIAVVLLALVIAIIIVVLAASLGLALMKK